MTHRTRLVGIAIIVAAAGFGFLPKPGQALTLVPPTLEYTVQPGQTLEPKVKLYNEETEAISVFASTANFDAGDEEGSPNFLFEDTPTDLASWIEFPQGALTLQPDQRIEVPIKITVPANAEPGGHYASLFFGTDPSLKPQEGGQVNIQSLIGTLVIIRVEGDVRELASIAEFAATKSSYARLPVEFTLRIKNEGNVHIKPQGTVTITNLWGGQTTRLTLNEVNGAVLPNSYRRFNTQWHKVDTTGDQKGFFTELKNEWHNFALGSYTATAVVTYGQSRLTLQDKVQVTMVPWRLLSVGALLVIVIILILTFGIKAYNRAIIQRAQGTVQKKQSTPPGPKS
jgi:hypothetical protein